MNWSPFQSIQYLRCNIVPFVFVRQTKSTAWYKKHESSDSFCYTMRGLLNISYIRRTMANIRKSTAIAMTDQSESSIMYFWARSMIKAYILLMNCIELMDLLLTQPPLLFNHDKRLLRTNSPMQSTIVCTITGCPCRTQSTARAPATAYRDTIFPHVTPVERQI